MSKHLLVWVTVCSLVFSPLSLSLNQNIFQSSGDNRGLVTLTPNEARAAAIVHDPIHWLGLLAKWVLDEAYKVALETMKQNLIKLQTQAQVDFVRNVGGAASRIVENWPVELQTAFNMAFDGFLTEFGLANTLCNNIKIPTQFILTKMRVGGGSIAGSGQPYCTPQNVLNNINYSFTNIFTSNVAGGGFIGYGTLVRENPFEQMRLAIQESVNRSNTQAEGKKNEVTSASGFRSTKRCLSWGPFAPLGMDEDTPGWEEFCDYTQDTTPGITTKDQTEGSTDTQSKFTVNITSIFSIVVSSFVNSLFNKVLTAGKGGLLSLTGGSVPAPYNPASLCTGKTGQALLACQAAIGDFASLQAAAPGIISTATSETNQLISVLNQAVACEQAACAAAISAGQSSTFCTTQTPAALGQATAHLSLIQQVQANIAGSVDASYIYGQLSQIQGSLQPAIAVAQQTLAQCQAAPPPPPPPPPPPVCGNGTIESGEQCEGGNLNGQSCVQMGFAGGNLTCNSACQYDTNACTGIAPPPVCGNGVIEAGEQCEGSNLNGKSCSNLSFTGGTLSCNSACQYDTNACTGTTAPPGTVSACANTFDDDNDGLIDFGTGPTNDPQCAGAWDNDETALTTTLPPPPPPPGTPPPPPPPPPGTPPPPGAPVVSISVSPSTVQIGWNAGLSWSVSNANSCTASGGTPSSSWSSYPFGSPPSGGYMNVSSFTPGAYTFTLTCSNASGSTSQSATLTVN